MKKIYVGPAIKVSAFVIENIVATSAITLNEREYNVVSDGIGVDSETKIQRVMVNVTL